jgi:mRNA interferase RelE/StbE
VSAWSVEYSKRAKDDLMALDNAQIQQVIKAIRKVAQNPLPNHEGGYGKPLGNLQTSRLAGCCKIKLRGLGLRVIYKLVRVGSVMRIIVIEARADDEVYEEAARRLKKEIDLQD